MAEKALLITVGLEDSPKAMVQDQVRELRELVLSTGVSIVDEIVCFRHGLTADLYVGKGKAEEIKQLCLKKGINTVVFNNNLSSTQQRNLEEVLEVKTIDRTQLILHIFARHARSPDGRLQVELAQTEYLLPRLSGQGIYLSRMGGGIGTRGPGEQKLEVDRRRIKDHISRLKAEIKSISQRREASRNKRKDSCVPTVALIGYTSAGKSTLLNALTKSKQNVSKYLFTTLDPLSRTLILKNNQKVILSDTVGFISDMPQSLLAAFKATLEEVVEADLLLNILDISDLRHTIHNEAVLKVLKELGVKDKIVITVLNKVDKLEDAGWLEKYKRDFSESVAISALKEENLGELLDLIYLKLCPQVVSVSFKLPLSRMDLVDVIYKEGKVESIEYKQDCVEINAQLYTVTADKIKSYAIN